MTDQTTATKTVNAYLRKIQDGSIELEIERSIEYPEFWFFNYNASEYLHNDNFSYALVGNLPLIVDKNEGGLFVLITNGSRFTFEEILLMPLSKLLYFEIIMKIENI